MSRERVAISNLPSVEQMTFEEFENPGFVSWDMSLPPVVDTERISLDMKRLHRLMGVSAIRSIHVVEGHQGERSEFEVNSMRFGSVSLGGEIAGTASGKMTKVPLDQTRLHDDYNSFGQITDRLMGDHGKTRVLTSFNRAELASRVADLKINHDKTNEQAWAEILDLSMKTSLKKAVTQHLMSRESSNFLKYSAYFVYGANLANAVEYPEVFATFGLPLFAACSAALVLGNEASARALLGKDSLKERRWSSTVYSRQQIDRFIAARALIGSQSFVKVRK